VPEKANDGRAEGSAESGASSETPMSQSWFSLPKDLASLSQHSVPFGRIAWPLTRSGCWVTVHDIPEDPTPWEASLTWELSG